MTSCLMDTSHDYLISTAHVSAEHAPYYIGWVRRAYEIAGEKFTVPLSRDDEQETLQELRPKPRTLNRSNSSSTHSQLGGRVQRIVGRH
jgi:hypothetical protein